MKDQGRTNFRPRQIDNAKPLTVIRDINDLLKKEEFSAYSTMANEDSIETPNKQINFSEQEIKKMLDLFDKKKTIMIPKAEKFEAEAKEGTKNLNNEQGSFSAVAQIYKQKKFIRPPHLIIYSHKNRLQPTAKEYEATLKDINYLQFEPNITVEEFEIAIAALENDVGRGELIPLERANEVLLQIFPDKKQNFKSIYTYWVARRDDFKKSLMRKYWKEQKFTDKFMATTFRKREREKMRTRRYKKNDLEGLIKLKGIRDVNQNILVNLLKAGKDREQMKKVILELNELDFELQIAESKAVKSCIESRYKDIVRNYVKPPKYLYVEQFKETTKKDIIKDHIELTTSSSISNEVIPKPIKDRKKPPFKKPPVADGGLAAPATQRGADKGTVAYKEPIRIEVKPKEQLNYKFRIRINRFNKIVIDRYQQIENSFNPFDDDYNVNLDSYVNEDESTKISEINFDSLFKKFKKENIFDEILTDNEDESGIGYKSNSSLSASFKHFLKHKRLSSQEVNVL